MPIFQDEVKTGGGVVLGAPAEFSKLNLRSRENPVEGKRVMEVKFLEGYKWEPGAWDAAAFLHTQGWEGFKTTPGKDLSARNYTRCTFHARSEPPTSVTFSAAEDSIVVPLTGEWQRYEIPLTEENQQEVKIFFVVSSPNHRPSRVFVDDVKYE